jgi:thiol:disulfide interchange protein
VNFPLRVVLALMVLVAISVLGVWGLISVVHATSMTTTHRRMAAGGIIALMATLAAVVIFLWPAYWD